MELIKNKTIRIKGMINNSSEADISELVMSIQGVKNVSANHSKGTVRVEYDLLQTKLKDIKQAINNSPYKLPDSPFQRTKNNCIDFFETNEIKTSQIEPAYCSKFCPGESNCNYGN